MQPFILLVINKLYGCFDNDPDSLSLFHMTRIENYLPICRDSQQGVRVVIVTIIWSVCLCVYPYRYNRCSIMRYSSTCGSRFTHRLGFEDKVIRLVRTQQPFKTLSYKFDATVYRTHSCPPVRDDSLNASSLQGIYNRGGVVQVKCDNLVNTVTGQERI